MSQTYQVKAYRFLQLGAKGDASWCGFLVRDANVDERGELQLPQEPASEEDSGRFSAVNALMIDLAQENLAPSHHIDTSVELATLSRLFRGTSLLP